MRIVVLTKPVPDPASGGERLGPDGRLDRANSPAVVNGNDEYVLEKALKLIEAAGEGEVIAPDDGARQRARDACARRSAMGATRGVLVTDPALGGLRCASSTTRVLAAALKTLEFDLVFAGVDTSDGVARRRSRPGVAALAGLPYLSYAATIEPDAAAPAPSASSRITPTGYDVLEAPMPALISARRRSASRATRRSRGSWPRDRRRSRRSSLADLGIDPATVGRRGATTKVVGLARRRSRGPPRGSCASAPDEAARQVVGAARRAAAHLMGGDLGPRRARPATARSRSSAPRSRRWRGARRGERRGGRHGRRRRGRSGRGGRRSSRGYVPRVLAVTEPATARSRRGHDRRRSGWPRSSRQHGSRDVVLAGAGPEGRDVAGALSALTGLGRARQRDGRARLGRRADRHAQRVRRQAHHRERAHRRPGHRHGAPEQRDRRAGRAPPGPWRPATAAGAATTARGAGRRSARRGEPAAAPIEDARIIVAGGRGVGGPDGFGLIERPGRRRSAARSARRARRSIRAGSRYSQQIGQTGKIVKPQLYLAMGISGAIQHKVGMQTARRSSPSTATPTPRSPTSPT